MRNNTNLGKVSCGVRAGGVAPAGQLRHQSSFARQQAATARPAPSPVIQGLLAHALRHHQAGRLTEAEPIYRQILAVAPHHPDCLHLLGMIEYQAGRPQLAAEMIRNAIAINRKQAAYHSNLGTVLQSQGELDEAAKCYKRALALQPELARGSYQPW